ncbi:integrase catalytic domain-containing protein [Trichonephila clavipes]|nr:integrase catalytic domain-containing protein [Trichonephila clavipes]
MTEHNRPNSFSITVNRIEAANVYTATKDINELDSTELKIRKNRFDVIGEELKTLFDNLFSLAKDDEIEGYILEKQELLDTWEEMLILLERRVSHLNKTNKSTEVFHTRNSDSTEIKLPTLSLPTFSGVIDEWLTFSDLFQAAVTNNQNLTGAQKLQYLKGVLKGDAQKIVQSLPITDGNFQMAWDLLKERYFHKREILSSLMKKLRNISPITCESHAQILKLVDSTKEGVRLLETLDLKVEGTADIILMFIIQFKLDSTTRGWWERSLDNEKIPSLSELLQFLSNHARSLMTEGYGVKRNISNKKVTLVASGFQLHCSYCQSNHNLNKCDAFQNLSVQKRVNFVKSNNICFNCLTKFHRKSACKSTNKCRKCGKSHHTLLHFMTPSEPNSSIPRDDNNSVLTASAKVFYPVVFDATNTDTGPNPPNVNNPSITSCSGFDSNSQVLLCTALDNVCDSFGGTRLCRVLDPGSQACLITNSCLERLGLPRKRTNVRISCLGASDTRTNGISEIKFTPHFTSNISFVTSVYVVNKIVGQLPHFSLDSSWSEPFSDLKLADPTFFKSGPIDILIGVNIALPMLKGQSLSLGDNKPFAVRSDLGWIVAGNVPSEDMFSSIAVNSIQVVTDELVRVTFGNTHVRNEDGRYVVRLPFHSSPSKLGDSRESAIRRFKSLEHSLIKKPAIYSQYRDFMQEYLTLGHMELVPKNDYAKREAYYLPHHAVLRDSSTTKLRVVFDASAKSTSGYSLNDILMRDNPKETVKEYRLTTVTYGTSCAPYLSTRTLTQLAFDERERYPLASFATLHHFYVDDLLSGAATEKEAVELVWQLKEMMKKGGFNLRKWQSNSEIVIKEVAENKDLKRMQNDEEIKILGIQWNPKSDFFSFSVSLLEERCIYSKKDVLSEIARVFDPLGLLSPCIVFMKILLQELWKLNLEWDEPIPEDLNKQWTTFRKELHLIEKMKIPRCVLLPSYIQLEIHAFCDSSVRAYCTAIYLKCIASESISVSLLTSKTRVAPLKTQSLPRLELCAALLLSNVLQVVLREFPLSIHRTIAWTDSTVTLAWLKTEPYRWQPFVANRVSKIQTTIPSVEWCHVSGIENPADLGTRGLLPSQLVAHDQWIHGPLWLNQPMNETSSYKIPETFSFPDNALKEKRSVVTCVAKIVPLPEFIDRISSFTKLVHVCAWILRFIKNSRSPVSRTFGYLEIIGTSYCSCYYCTFDSTSRISE